MRIWFVKEIMIRSVAETRRESSKEDQGRLGVPGQEARRAEAPIHQQRHLGQGSGDGRAAEGVTDEARGIADGIAG